MIDKLTHIFWYLTCKAYRIFLKNKFYFKSQRTNTKYSCYRYLHFESKNKDIKLVFTINTSWYDVKDNDILEFSFTPLSILIYSNNRSNDNDYLSLSRSQIFYLLDNKRSNLEMNPLPLIRKNKLSKIC